MEAKLKAWVETILSNDETSTDEQLIEHFIAEGGIERAEAVALVARRNEFLSDLFDEYIVGGVILTRKEYLREIER
uniref:hypothetical protein n=1 Tax=Cupriavidus gilardii TaxID=82541 RepID=UPI00247AE531|nr:hypothetical protein [Cupriavidus gilardii]WDE72671.1 hypothetical protein [Cupriavidus gilardii]